MFIVFEGLESSGKSTQIKRLSKHLCGKGYDVELVAEPGTTALGLGVRELVQLKEISVNPLSELLLYETARAQVTEERIKPALQAGKVVLADRYSLSSIAYQGYGRGLDLRRLRALDRWATDDLQPDLTLFFNIPIDEMRKRQGQDYQPDRLEKETFDFFKRVQRGYLKELKRIKGVHILDGVQAPQRLFEQVKVVVGPLLDAL